jgi:hypothetical protein
MTKCLIIAGSLLLSGCVSLRFQTPTCSQWLDRETQQYQHTCNSETNHILGGSITGFICKDYEQFAYVFVPETDNRLYLLAHNMNPNIKLSGECLKQDNKYKIYFAE